MNTTIVLIILFFVLVCIVPLVMTRRNNKRAEKALLEKLLSMAKENHNEVAQHNLLDNLAIGLSESGNILFFVNIDHDKNIMEVVDLSEVEKCSLNKPIRRSLDGKDATIERIELIFTFKDKQRPIKKLEFYNLEFQSLTLRGELQLAEKWYEVVINRLKPVS